MMSIKNTRIWFSIATLVIIYFGAVFVRVEFGQQAGNKYFSSESALQFYYARMAAQGHQIPEIDYKAQYPEGLTVHRSLSVFMEYVVGGSFKILKSFSLTRDWVEGIGFEKFVRLYIPFYISFSVFAVYLCALTLGRDKKSLGPFIAAGFYAVVLPAVSRASGWEFLREIFGLPFIFFHLYFFLKAISESRQYISALLAGILLALALICWHLAQFYYFILVFFMVGMFLLEPDTKESVIGRGVLEIITLCVFCAGILTPHLRTSKFIFSHLMLVSYSLIIGRFILNKLDLKDLVGGKRFLVRLGVLAGLIVVVGGILILTKGKEWGTTYSHVFSTLVYKIIFFRGKPFDPSLLPYEVRQLWVPPFLSPGLSSLFYNFSLLLVPCLAGIWVLGKGIKKDRCLQGVYCIYVFFCFMLFFLFFSRMVTFFIFPVCVFTGLSLEVFRSKYKKYYSLGLVVLVIILGLEAVVSLKGAKRKSIKFLQPKDKKKILYSRKLEIYALSDPHQGLFTWIRENTTEDDVFLSHFSTSPPILAYTGRSIVLQSKFEAKYIREKVEEFLSALFDTEQTLYNYALNHKADYLVYTADTFLDNSLQNWRYMANRLSWDEDNIAYRMHFQPQGLSLFKLIYENGFYRVYKVLNPDRQEAGGQEQKKGLSGGKNKYLIYNEKLFRKWGLPELNFAHRVNLAHRYYLQGLILESYGYAEQARDFYKKSQGVVPEFDLAKQKLRALSFH